MFYGFVYDFFLQAFIGLLNRIISLWHFLVGTCSLVHKVANNHSLGPKSSFQKVLISFGGFFMIVLVISKNLSRSICEVTLFLLPKKELCVPPTCKKREYYNHYTSLDFLTTSTQDWLLQNVDQPRSFPNMLPNRLRLLLFFADPYRNCQVAIKICHFGWHSGCLVADLTIAEM